MENLLEQALNRMIDDMNARGFGAIIWSIPDAGFHYIPDVVVKDEKTGETRSTRVTGLYVYDGQLYAIEEDKEGINVNRFYTPGVEVKPVVVTLSPSKAKEYLGEPTEERGFTQQGTLEEWAAIADCYFEAVNEEEEE